MSSAVTGWLCLGYEGIGASTPPGVLEDGAVAVEIGAQASREPAGVLELERRGRVERVREGAATLLLSEDWSRSRR
jgi:hypothetical protein